MEYLRCYLNGEPMAIKVLKKIKRKLNFIWGKSNYLNFLKDCYGMLLHNHTATMDTHHGIIPWVNPSKINWEFHKTSVYVFAWSLHFAVIWFLLISQKKTGRRLTSWIQTRTMYYCCRTILCTKTAASVVSFRHGLKKNPWIIIIVS